MYSIAMAQIAHPETDDSIEVEVIDEESHNGDYVQVEAVEDGVELTDESGDSPWMSSEDVVFEAEGKQGSTENADEVEGL